MPNRQRKRVSSNGSSEVSKYGILVIGENIPLKCIKGVRNGDGAFYRKSPSVTVDAGADLLAMHLTAMQDIVKSHMLPVHWQNPVTLYMDQNKGEVCLSVLPQTFTCDKVIDQELDRAVSTGDIPEIVVLVDCGGGAWTPKSFEMIRPTLDSWGSPVFLLDTSKCSHICGCYNFTGIVRQSYCSHQDLFTYSKNTLYIHDLAIGGFYNKNTFQSPLTKDCSTPGIGLGEMAMAYIVSEYARDASLHNDLGRSLAFLKYAFTSEPAESLATRYGRSLVKQFEESRK